MPRHHLTRRELRHDTFLETVASTQAWVEDHAYLVAGAAVVLLILVLGGIGFTRHSQSHRQEMEAAFARCGIDFDRGSFQTAAVAYENFLARYPGSPSAREAVIRAAAAHLFVGNPSSAQDLYQRYLDKYAGDPLLDRAAKTGLAACLESTGRPADAARIHQELADSAPDAQDRASHLAAAARCQEQLGDFSAAAQLAKDAWAAGGPALQDPTLRPRLIEMEAREHLRSSSSQPFVPVLPATADSAHGA